MAGTVGKRGYVLPKAGKSQDLVDSIKKDLTVKPLVNPDYAPGPAVEYPIFTEDSDNLYLPRFYGLKRIGPAQMDFPALQESPFMESTLRLRDYQVDVVEKTLATLRDPGGGILAIATGLGKVGDSKL